MHRAIELKSLFDSTISPIARHYALRPWHFARLLGAVLLYGSHSLLSALLRNEY